MHNKKQRKKELSPNIPNIYPLKNDNQMNENATAAKSAALPCLSEYARRQEWHNQFRKKIKRGNTDYVCFSPTKTTILVKTSPNGVRRRGFKCFFRGMSL